MLYAYFATDGKLTKIGLSENPTRRAKQLKAEILFALPHFGPGGFCERALHVHFADKRVHGEWFELSAEDLQSVRKLRFRSYFWENGNPLSWAFCECHPYPMPKGANKSQPLYLGFARPKDRASLTLQSS